MPTTAIQAPPDFQILRRLWVNWDMSEHRQRLHGEPLGLFLILIGGVYPVNTFNLNLKTSPTTNQTRVVINIVDTVVVGNGS